LQSLPTTPLRLRNQSKLTISILKLINFLHLCQGKSLFDRTFHH
jgi:hypothetical protein